MTKSWTAADSLLGYGNPAYDKAAKRFLSKRKMLAHILKRTVPEFSEVSIRDIAEKYIEGDPQVGEVSLNRDKTNAPHAPAAEITGDRNEDGSPTEGWITFDILFHAKAPSTGEPLTLIINIEAQKTDRTGYALLKRAVYYASRLISSQKETEFSGSDYDGIKKVYTIWLCMDTRHDRNAINRYDMMERHLFRHYQAKQSDYDLLSIVMVYLGSRRTKDRLLELLRLVFKEEIAAAEKKVRLAEEYQLDLTSDMEEELSTMCNLSEGIADRAERRGEKRGERRGERRGAENTWRASISSLMAKLDLTMQEAAKLLDVPADIQRKLQKS
jgi:hypothetical protein